MAIMSAEEHTALADSYAKSVDSFMTALGPEAVLAPEKLNGETMAVAVELMSVYSVAAEVHIRMATLLSDYPDLEEDDDAD